jgi:hypothetical protein
MRFVLSAILMMTTLFVGFGPSFADDWRGRYSNGRRAQYAYEREHPRWPRQYCHKHKYPLHSDDKRRHCHNWDDEDRFSARGRPSYWGWRR